MQCTQEQDRARTIEHCACLFPRHPASASSSALCSKSQTRSKPKICISIRAQWDQIKRVFYISIECKPRRKSTPFTVFSSITYTTVCSHCGTFPRSNANLDGNQTMSQSFQTSVILCVVTVGPLRIVSDPYLLRVRVHKRSSTTHQGLLADNSES